MKTIPQKLKYLTLGLVLMWSGIFPASKAAPPTQIIFGLYVENLISDAEKAQYLNLLNSLVRAYNEKSKTKIVIKKYASGQLLDNDVRQKKIHVSLNNLVWAGRLGYKPFITYGIFNSFASRDCLFVQAKSSYKKVSELKGKRLAIREDSGAQYGRLMLLAKEDPMRFAEKLLAGKNEPSLAYMVTLGQVEAAMLNDWVVSYMKLSNPGAVKKLRPLECAPACPSHIFIHNSLSPQQQGEIRHFFTNIKTLPELRRLQSTIKLLGFVTRPFDPVAEKQCEAKRKEADKIIFGKNDSFQFWRKLTKAN